ncbi:MAG: hypothetical protein EB100_02600 [Crocinitomicaceae bacterium]|nr:hypothetical protein [Crocinitomicaceae bacterium]
MKQDDYLLNQIDLLGKVLAKIIDLLLGRKNETEVFEINQLTLQTNEYGAPIKIIDVLELPNSELIEFLITHNFKIHHIEKLGELFYLLSKDNSNIINCLEKSLILYNYVQNHSLTYSSERVKRITKIEVELATNDSL